MNYPGPSNAFSRRALRARDIASDFKKLKNNIFLTPGRHSSCHSEKIAGYAGTFAVAGEDIQPREKVSITD
jgi:hypothetical protein